MSCRYAYMWSVTAGHIQILYGNLAPEGSVAKITGKEGLLFEGEALVFDCEEDMIEMVGKEPNKFRGKVRSSGDSPGKGGRARGVGGFQLARRDSVE